MFDVFKYCLTKEYMSAELPSTKRIASTTEAVDNSSSKTTTSSVLDHYLIPKHEILTNEEAQKIFEIYGISFENLPKIDKADPAIKAIKGKSGDIVRITRANGKVYYRGVI